MPHSPPLVKSTPSGGATRHDSPVAPGRRARCSRPSAAGLEHDAWNQPHETTVARRPVAWEETRERHGSAPPVAWMNAALTPFPHRSKMQTTVLALALGSAAAFSPNAAPRATTIVRSDPNIKTDVGSGWKPESGGFSSTDTTCLDVAAATSSGGGL